LGLGAPRVSFLYGITHHSGPRPAGWLPSLLTGHRGDHRSSAEQRWLTALLAYTGSRLLKPAMWKQPLRMPARSRQSTVPSPSCRLLCTLVLACAAEVLASEEACTCGNGRAKLFGPGGPHTALQPTADLWNLLNPTQVPVEICFGPEPTWRDRAQECAAGLFAGAEQQMSGFLRRFSSRVEGQPVSPITMHSASLIVPSGNPLRLTSLRRVIDYPPDEQLRVVVNDGNLHDSLTSSTALWEDVVGRSGSLRDSERLREKIVAFTANSGEARDMILRGEADVWISWHDWWVANQESFSSAPIERELSVCPYVSVCVRGCLVTAGFHLCGACSLST
jgi:accessory colonization factor AcfC